MCFDMSDLLPLHVVSLIWYIFVQETQNVEDKAMLKTRAYYCVW